MSRKCLENVLFARLRIYDFLWYKINNSLFSLKIQIILYLIILIVIKWNFVDPSLENTQKHTIEMDDQVFEKSFHECSKLNRNWGSSIQKDFHDKSLLMILVQNYIKSF